MKRIGSFVLLLVSVVSLCACGKETVTMQEIYDASHLSSQLANHESVYVQYMANGEDYAKDYLTKDYAYSLYVGEFLGMSSDMAFFTTDDAFYSYADGNYARTLRLSADGLSDIYRTEDDAVIVLGPEMVQETIQSVTKKNNCITVTSFMDQEDAEAAGMAGLVSSSGEYVLDAKTRELIYTKCVSDYGDGMVDEVVSEISYDAEIPEGLKAFLEYDQQTENLRTITVVSNPGAENEKRQSVQVPKGLAVSLEPAPDTDETFALYADAACTEAFAFSEDHNSDVVIYVKWGE